MLELGRSYKVKVELEPGKVGYGRATVLEKTGSKSYIQLRTSKELNHVLPGGSRIWFVTDSPTSTLNGMWTTNVTGTKLFNGKTAMECGPLKFEAMAQRRRSQRVPLVCPVRLSEQQLSYAVRSRNVSRSGIGLEANSQYVDEFPVGELVEIVLLAPMGELPIKCRVIRTEYNWLSNKTTIGLQFEAMSQEVIEALEKLRSQSDGNEENRSSASSLRDTLSGPLRKSRNNMRLTRSGQQPAPESEQSFDPDDF